MSAPGGPPSAPPHARGLFVTCEGLDGVGKSTQVRLLAERLRAEGRTVVATREPGGSAGAEEIRHLLVSGAPGRWSAETELLLFTAARRDHVERTIRPALEAGAVVLCDRFVDSTRAYQAAGRGAAPELVEALHDLVIGLTPDLTLIYDLAPEAARARWASDAAARPDRFERFGPAFQDQLRAAFRAIAAAAPERCRVLDAAQPAEALADLGLAELHAALDARGPGG